MEGKQLDPPAHCPDQFLGYLATLAPSYVCAGWAPQQEESNRKSFLSGFPPKKAPGGAAKAPRRAFLRTRKEQISSLLQAPPGRTARDGRTRGACRGLAGSRARRGAVGVRIRSRPWGATVVGTMETSTAVEIFG